MRRRKAAAEVVGETAESGVRVVGERKLPFPEHWETATVGEVALITGGLTKNGTKRDASPSRVPLVSVAAVHLRRIDPSQVGEIGLLDSDGDRATLEPGDLLMVEGNGSLDHIGRVALWNNDVTGARHQNHIIRIRPKRVSASFLLEWLASPEGRRAIVQEATSATGLYTLSLSKVARLPAPIPPLDEQRRIVTKLDALSERSRRAKEALDAVRPLLDKLRQSILAAAFRGDLTREWRAQNPDVEPASELLKRIRAERRRRWEEAELAKLTAKGKPPADDRWKAKYKEPEPVDTEGLPELPEGWCWARWAEVGFCQNGRAFPSAEYADAGVRLLRPGNLHISGAVEWTEKNTRYMPPKWAEDFPEFVVGGSELLMNLTAQSLKDDFLGRVCLTGSGEQCLLNQRIGRLTPVLLLPEYCLYWMKSPPFRRFVDALNTGSLIQHMFTSQVDEHLLPVAPVQEQRAVVRKLRRATGTLRDIENSASDQVRGLDVLTQALLTDAFRGKLLR